MKTRLVAMDDDERHNILRMRRYFLSRYEKDSNPAGQAGMTPRSGGIVRPGPRGRSLPAGAAGPAGLLENRRRGCGVGRRVDGVAPRFDLPAATVPLKDECAPTHVGVRYTDQPQLPFAVGDRQALRRAADVVQLQRMDRPLILLPSEQIEP